MISRRRASWSERSSTVPRRAVKAFRPPVRSKAAPVQNRDGYPAWERPLKEQYLQTLLTNTFGNSFYAKASDLAVESEAVHTAMLTEDPAFAAKALLYAREKGYMRTQPIYGLARLFSHKGGGSGELPQDPRNAAANIFDRGIRTPNYLADFTAIVKTLRNGEGGRAIKRSAGKWLLSKLGEYQVIKYGAEKGDGSYSLKDMLQVYHPDAGGKKLPLFDYIMGRHTTEAWGLNDSWRALPQILHFEELKRATTDEMKVDAIT